MKRDFKFKPYIKWLLFAAVVIYSVIMILVQQAEIKEQTALLDELVSTEEQLTDRIEALEGEINYMQTDEYKLQQGSVRYGWHYTDDSIILDDDNASLLGGSQ